MVEVDYEGHGKTREAEIHHESETRFHVFPAFNCTVSIILCHVIMLWIHIVIDRHG